jgi:hypothetical protein
MLPRIAIEAQGCSPIAHSRVALRRCHGLGVQCSIVVLSRACRDGGRLLSWPHTVMQPALADYAGRGDTLSRVAGIGGRIEPLC